jgi:hypothetical protein
VDSTSKECPIAVKNAPTMLIQQQKAMLAPSIFSTGIFWKETNMYFVTIQE